MKDFYTYQFEDLMIYQTPTLWKTYKNYNYIIAKNNLAYIIDPGEALPILKTIRDNKLSVKAIYLTHHHPDHVNATEELSKKWGCEVFGFDKDQKRLPCLTKTFRENDKLSIAGYNAQVLFLPGHTLGLCAFYFKNLNILFSNDLIFSLGCGRVFEGSYQQMQQSLKRVTDLPDNTLLFSSHEYTLDNLKFGLALFPDDKKLLGLRDHIIIKSQHQVPTIPTPLSFEKEYNPFLRWNDPYIRKKMELEDAEDWEVFAEIRQLKDRA